MQWCKIEFSHLDDDRLWDLLSDHGIAGHGFYLWLYTELYRLEDQGFQIEYTPRWLRRTAHTLFCEPEQIEVLLNYLSELNLINRQLWSDSIIFMDVIAQHADAYMQKKIKERDRKRLQRENKGFSDLSHGTAADSHGTTTMSQPCPAESQNVTPADPDPDPDPDSDPKTKAKTNSKKKIAEPKKLGHQDQPLPRSVDQGETIPIMRVIEETDPALAAKARQHHESKRRISYTEPFEAWWRSYYKFCLIVKVSAGSKVISS